MILFLQNALSEPGAIGPRTTGILVTSQCFPDVGQLWDGRVYNSSTHPCQAPKGWPDIYGKYGSVNCGYARCHTVAATDSIHSVHLLTSISVVNLMIWLYTHTLTSMLGSYRIGTEHSVGPILKRLGNVYCYNHTDLSKCGMQSSWFRVRNPCDTFVMYDGNPMCNLTYPSRNGMQSSGSRVHNMRDAYVIHDGNPMLLSSIFSYKPWMITRLADHEHSTWIPARRWHINKRQWHIESSTGGKMTCYACSHNMSKRKNMQADFLNAKRTIMHSISKDSIRIGYPCGVIYSVTGSYNTHSGTLSTWTDSKGQYHMMTRINMAGRYLKFDTYRWCLYVLVIYVLYSCIRSGGHIDTVTIGRLRRREHKKRQWFLSIWRHGADHLFGTLWQCILGTPNHMFWNPMINSASIMLCRCAYDLDMYNDRANVFMSSLCEVSLFPCNQHRRVQHT